MPAIGGTDVADLRMPQAFAPLAAPPLFLTGTGRSGKSMTFDLFAAHPEVCAIFETWLHMPASGVTGIFHQPQWDATFYARQRERIGHEHAAVQLVSFAEAAAEIGEMLARWSMRRVRPGQRFLVEKTPVDVVALVALFPQARLVHMIRDGRDVVRSQRVAAGTWAPEMAADVATLAAGWRERVLELREAAPLMGDRYLEVRFEEQRSDLRGVTRRLFDFAAIPHDDALLDRVIEGVGPEAYTPAARASGFRGGGRVGGWRSDLTQAEGRAFDAEAGQLLVELGYAGDRDWWRELPAAPARERVRDAVRRALLRAQRAAGSA